MNQVFTHPGQPQMQVEVILASKSTVEGTLPIYTIRMRYPRIIHGELMTHRVFSRNARSSRAVPVKTMLLECTTIPFVPWHWGKNQKGMQAGEECNELVNITHSDGDIELMPQTAKEAWLYIAAQSADTAKAYMEAGYHKQIPNRLLEPFSWIDTLVTSTHWANFLWLRDHKDAEPHLQDLARLVKQAIDAAEIQTLAPGGWHLPYVSDDELGDDIAEWLVDHPQDFNTLEMGRRISAARCARISYKPFDGDASYDRELERHNSLVTADRVHASPTEHQATPDTKTTRWSDEPWWDSEELHGNFTGWIQNRKLIPNEAVME